MGIQTLALTIALLASGGPDIELLEFSATYCGPCRRMAPVIDDLVAEGYPIRKLDTDKDRALATQYNVAMVPCFIVLRGGREVDRFVGAMEESQLRQFLERHGAKPRFDASAMTLPGSVAAPRAMPVCRTEIWTRQESSQARLKKVAAIHGVTNLQDAAILASTVRLRIHESNNSFSKGTGTIIDSQHGEALIVTCAHVFRDYKDGLIEVEIFDTKPPRSVEGKLVGYNDRLDVGFLRIRVGEPVMSLPVAPPDYTVRVGDPVANAGCNHGADPTIRHNVVTAINRFVGAPNIEVKGQPVQGRSGGGLFSQEGYLIGICNAADPALDEGIYAGLESVIQELDRLQFSFVYQQPSSRAVGQVAVGPPPAMPSEMPPIRTPAAFSSPLLANNAIDVSRLRGDQVAMLREIERQMSTGADILCLVCPSGPQQTAMNEAHGRVIVVDPESRDAITRAFAPNAVTAPGAPAVLPTSSPMVAPAGWNRSTSADIVPVSPQGGSGAASSSWGYPLR